MNRSQLWLARVARVRLAEQQAKQEHERAVGDRPVFRLPSSTRAWFRLNDSGQWDISESPSQVLSSEQMADLARWLYTTVLEEVSETGTASGTAGAPTGRRLILEKDEEAPSS